MAQGNSSVNTANVHPACLSDKTPSNRRWRNMAERYQHSNSQDNNSSAASDSGTSTDWDGCWGTQECSACGGEGHNTRYFQTPELLLQHRNREHNFECIMCNDAFPSEDQLTAHQVVKHGKPITEEDE